MNYTDNPDDITPIMKRGDIWVKRDDMFGIGGVHGGKVRTCWHLSQGAKGLVTAGSRMSPQVNIVAHIAKRLGVPCRVHTPQGTLSPEVEDAKTAGAVVVQHKAGYNNVIISRAREDAKKQGWTEIPFGMDCEEAVTQTRKQVRNIPDGVKRIVMPVGSAMSLSGVLHGLLDQGLDIPVLGITVGAAPNKRLDRYAPKVSSDPFFEDPAAREKSWQEMVTLKEAGMDYHAEYKEPVWRGITLDPIYEAKCIPFLEPGDLFWVIGIRKTFMAPDQPYAP